MTDCIWRDKLKWNFLVISAVVVILISGQAAPEETCHFPQFLQGSPLGGSKKTWTTRWWWLHIRDEYTRWEEKQEIYVKNGVMWRHRENNQNCERSPRRVYKTKFGQCSDRQLVYNRTCISKEGANTYKVLQYNADRRRRYTCMRFVKRSDNVVQVYEVAPIDNDDPGLCYTNRFRLDEWPWIAPWNKAPSACPISGGFSFRTIKRLINADLCEEEWRRSTLEIECLRGDGMVFMAPKGSKCNPFLNDGDVKKLICWASWENDDFIFMIASDVGRQPSYCLRFPRVQNGEFSVLVYISVICPTEPDGKPPQRIEYYELKMYRKDPMSCRDEDHKKCQELIISPETCAKDTIIAPHCPKTCGKCVSMVMNDIKQRRCGFDPNLFGEWVLYDQSGKHEVAIDKAQVVLSQLASLHCLSPGNVGQTFLYKTSSLFENGCSPRYTCIELDRKNNNVLQYRLGTSHREEKEMEDLCIFRNEQPPLKDSVRSYYFKNLILARKLWPSYCGLDGEIPFNGTINGRHCQGTVSDWDTKTCTTRGTVVLQSETCKELILPMEFQCLGFIHEDTIPLRQLLLTRSMDGSHSFNCWVITSYVGQAEWPRRVMFQMPNTQCSLLMEYDPPIYNTYQISIYLDDKRKQKECRPEQVTPRQITMKELDKPTAIPNRSITEEARRIRIKNNRYKIKVYSTESTIQASKNEANLAIVRNSWITILLFQCVLTLFVK